MVDKRNYSYGNMCTAFICGLIVGEILAVAIFAIGT